MKLLHIMKKKKHFRVLAHNPEIEGSVPKKRGERWGKNNTVADKGSVEKGLLLDSSCRHIWARGGLETLLTSHKNPPLCYKPPIPSLVRSNLIC